MQDHVRQENQNDGNGRRARACRLAAGRQSDALAEGVETPKLLFLPVTEQQEQDAVGDEAAVLAALTCVATMVVQIPSPMNGFVNLGDCFVLLSGWLLGPWWGGAAGGIGSMLADLLLGYGHYAPGTLIIKGLMALVGALIFKALGKSSMGALVSGHVSEIIMVAGYFGYAALLLGKGIGAAASVPGNLVQGAVGLIAGFLLLQVARRTHLEEKVSV